VQAHKIRAAVLRKKSGPLEIESIEMITIVNLRVESSTPFFENSFL
jgi:hypothetical protein